jgi:glycosyltransferase involved in cell wall biosynthesis
MAGIGIRYFELARQLPERGVDVVLVSPADPAETASLSLPGVEIRRFERGRLADVLHGCDAAVAQGQLANDVLLELPDLPVAIDLYDPWLIENLSYAATLGLDPYRNDHATWVLQMSRGDFFLCSSEEQRGFYLGFLAALGRVNPERLERDPDLETLIAPVPFGVPGELPPHRPVLPPRKPGERRLLFGGLYDWYDPWTLLDALSLLDVPGWTLLLIRNPNADSTPQRLLAEVEARCRKLGWWESRVEVLDWVPAERRYDLLRDVDLLVAPHRPSLETRLSLRTRFLDALAAGCPVITSAGGTMSRLLREHGAGWVVPPGDAEALARALREVLTADEPALRARQLGARELLRAFSWDRVLEPLVRFCRDPRRDDTKERFAHRPATVAPPDPLPFRLKRRLRLWRLAR